MPIPDDHRSEMPTSTEDEQVDAFKRPVQRIQDIPSVSELPEQKIEFLVDGYIGKPSLTLSCGEAGAGKSTCALALACAVSKGEVIRRVENSADTCSVFGSRESFARYTEALARAECSNRRPFLLLGLMATTTATRVVAPDHY